MSRGPSRACTQTSQLSLSEPPCFISSEAPSKERCSGNQSHLKSIAVSMSNNINICINIYIYVRKKSYYIYIYTQTVSALRSARMDFCLEHIENGCPAFISDCAAFAGNRARSAFRHTSANNAYGNIGLHDHVVSARGWSPY